MNSKPYLPSMGSFLNVITSPISGRYKPATQSESSDSIPEDNHPVTMSLDLANTVVFQKGINKEEKMVSPPKTISGDIVVYVFTPARLCHLKIEFRGKKYITLQKSAYHNTQSPLVKCRTLVYDTVLWKQEDVLPIGIYNYSFTFVVEPSLPETVDTANLQIHYELDVSMKYTLPSSNSQKLKTIRRFKEVQLVRCLSEEDSTEPLIARGNWRNIILYEFTVQSKVAFQCEDYSTTIKIYPLALRNCNFTIHNVSVLLVQKITTMTSNMSKKTINRSILLSSRTVEESHTGTEDCSLQHVQSVRIPSYEQLVQDIHTKSPTRIQPDFCDDTELGFSCSHQIKVCFEISELSPSTKVFQNSLLEVAECGKRGESASIFPSRTPFALKDRSKFNSNKKVELSFTHSIMVLSAQSFNGSISPPSYDCEESGSNYTYIGKSRSPSVFASNILPPSYESYES
ncbi:hypothetical protein G9P44_005265 [Scheffersomyces stipitis]|nr:hypothetical protein G9P44_005265 [Scheffersomyces stipitis]